MHWSMKKSQKISMKILAVCITDLKNYLPSFPGSNDSKKMEEDNINNILLHTIPNGWRNRLTFKAGTLNNVTAEKIKNMVMVIQ